MNFVEDEPDGVDLSALALYHAKETLRQEEEGEEEYKWWILNLCTQYIELSERLESEANCCDNGSL